MSRGCKCMFTFFLFYVSRNTRFLHSTLNKSIMKAVFYALIKNCFLVLSFEFLSSHFMTMHYPYSIFPSAIFLLLSLNQMKYTVNCSGDHILSCWRPDMSLAVLQFLLWLLFYLLSELIILSDEI